MLFKSKLIVILSFFLSIYQVNLYAQNKVVVTLKGLKSGDTALLRIQKSGEEFKFKFVGGTGSDIIHTFDTLSNGKWALSVDAKTYIFPTASVIELNNNSFASTVQLTKAPVDSNFVYQWQDDSSFVGHAQQAYINDKVEIVVLGKAEKVPDDFNGIQLLYTYGFLLNDSLSKWTSEEAYRLYQNISKFNFRKFGEKDSVFVRAKIFITDQFISRDIDFRTVNGVDIITISRAAFTYASPLVVTLDGVKGKYFSKRLFGACVYYYTDKGVNGGRINEIAKSRYGLEFLPPIDLITTLMGEHKSNFQEFTSDEKIVILSMLEEFPDAMQRQSGLKYLIRRINGQVDYRMPTASAIAFTGINTIEFMEMAFNGQDIQFMQRLVLHEKAHFLWEYTFDAITKSDWATLGGWKLDPTTLSGWSTNNTTEFVSAYAHLKNPNEDMAESIAFYVTNPDALRSRSIKKFEFVRDRIMQGSRYISVIRPDLTFQVYNLYPDYSYPGKIKRTKLEVIGKDTADKIIRLEIELTIQNPKLDGAKEAFTRFSSTIGTFKDMYLRPINDTGNILVGEMPLSKFAKSGFWKVDQIVTRDANNNARYENNTNFGLKCFVNNPLEDVTPPLYIQGSLRMDTLMEKFISLDGSTARQNCGSCADTLKPTQAVKVSFKIEEKNTINPFGRVFANIDFPTLDSTDKYNIKPYSIFAQIAGEGILNDKRDSTKTAQFYFPVPDYYPSGYYSITSLSMQDIALNERMVYLDKDTANKSLFMPPPSNVHQRALRDSVYIKTKTPDYKAPLLDINRITIKATPTNPAAPNGETLFEMWVWVKDTSDFVNNASGFASGYYSLRDPQGLEHYFNIDGNGSSYNNIFSDSSKYVYKQYYAKTLLPVGSPPGLWGVSSIVVMDQAKNKRYYSFTEIVRFDVELSKILQVTPYIEILGKKVNTKNQDSATVKFGCKDCKSQNYRLNIYSNMGGKNAVFEGKMAADTITLNNINLKGVNDGILYATVMMLDSIKALIGLGKATYTKDATVPTNYNLTPNRSLLGKSNLDSFIVAIKSVEINSSNQVVLKQISINPGSTGQIGDSIVLNSIRSMYTANLPVINSTTPTGSGNQYNVGFEGGMPSALMNVGFYDSTLRIPKSVFDKLADGNIEIKLISTDSLGNSGLSVSQFIYKDSKAPVLSIVNDSLVGLKKYVKLVSDEFISNTPTVSDFVVSNGVINSVSKLNSKSFGLLITKNCNDTLTIQLNNSALNDSVGNNSNVFTVKVADIVRPAIPLITSSKGAAICAGDSTVLTASSSTGTFAWSNNGVVIANATSKTYAALSAGNYRIVNTDTKGCSSESSSFTVGVNPLPAKPVISWSGVQFSTTATGVNYQWLLNGALVAGATASTHKPLNTGDFRLRVTDPNGCINVSDSFKLVVTAIGNVVTTPASNIATVYPNPATNRVVLEFATLPTINLNFQLVSPSGKVLSSTIGRNKVNVIDVSDVQSGNYFIRVIGKKYDQVKKVLIQK